MPGFEQVKSPAPGEYKGVEKCLAFYYTMLI